MTEQIPENRDGFKSETVPTFMYDEAAAERAWSEYVVLCDAEADLRRARMAAYNRLLAAFGQ